jgi:hypothetical protein
MSAEAKFKFKFAFGDKVEKDGVVVEVLWIGRDALGEWFLGAMIDGRVSPKWSVDGWEVQPTSFELNAAFNWCAANPDGVLWALLPSGKGVTMRHDPASRVKVEILLWSPIEATFDLATLTWRVKK